MCRNCSCWRAFLIDYEMAATYRAHMLARVSLILVLVMAAALHPVRAGAAGDVKVTQVGTTLHITGDAEANQISIVRDGAPPWYDGPGALAVGNIDRTGTI